MQARQLERVLERAEKICEQRGVKLTGQRKMVLRLLCGAERPLSAYELLEQLRGRLKKPAPPTVYRALDFLQQQGLIHKLESQHTYVGCRYPEQPHASQFLICSRCGEVDEVESTAINQSLQQATEAAGFSTERPVVELVGLCAGCNGTERER